MAASEPPPARARMTMPDLLPPTVREPGVLLVNARGSRSIVWVALALIVVGAAASGVAWFYFLRPTKGGDKRSKPAVTAPVEVEPTAPAPPSAPPPNPNVSGPTAQPAPIPAPASAAASAEPESGPGKERMSPCQTAIFSAVSGNCERARRAYERCEEASPYRASATRAVSGLCP
jgi:hypothetical protein